MIQLGPGRFCALWRLAADSHVGFHDTFIEILVTDNRAIIQMVDPLLTQALEESPNVSCAAPCES